MNLTLRLHSIPDSPLARWDARWKLAAILVAAVGIAALNHLWSAAAALALGAALLAASRLRVRWIAARLTVFALAALPFLLILPVTIEGPGWELGPIRVSEHGLIAGLACSRDVWRSAASRCFSSEPRRSTRHWPRRIA